MLVFISWSGLRSKAVAEALEDWLAQVIQAAEPWISQDIDKGLRWGTEIADRLERSKVGIICLTKSNLDAKWIHFEAGALSKTKDAYVCTLLLDIKPADVEQPLAQFQHTTTEKEQVFKLLKTINRVVETSGEKALTEARLRDVFETYWPRFDEVLRKSATLDEEAAVSSSRSDNEMLQEVLEILRNQERRQNRLPQSNPSDTRFEWVAAESAVLRWLERQYPDSVRRAEPSEGADFIVNLPDGTSMAVEVKIFSRSRLLLQDTRRIDGAVQSLHKIMLVHRYPKGQIVLVATHSTLISHLNVLIDELDAPNISFAIGAINSSGEFEAIRSTPIDF
ncbi:MAG TPA: TIR domain-containing protein [Pyrinomonadaceae bacterium]|jgi:hypothetical protein